MSGLRDVDLVRYSIRENIMSYFKGNAISRVITDFEPVNMRLVPDEHLVRNNRGREFRYAQRELEIANPKQLELSGVAIARLSKAPDTIKLNSRLTNGPSAAREVYSDIVNTVELYLPAVKLEFVELDGQERVDEVFSDKSLRRMLKEYLERISHTSPQHARVRPGMFFNEYAEFEPSDIDDFFTTERSS